MGNFGMHKLLNGKDEGKLGNFETVFSEESNKKQHAYDRQ